jgi:hypothetical protein
MTPSKPSDNLPPSGQQSDSSNPYARIAAVRERLQNVPHDVLVDFLATRTELMFEFIEELESLCFRLDQDLSGLIQSTEKLIVSATQGNSIGKHSSGHDFELNYPLFRAIRENITTLIQCSEFDSALALSKRLLKAVGNAIEDCDEGWCLGEECQEIFKSIFQALKKAGAELTSRKLWLEQLRSMDDYNCLHSLSDAELFGA